MLFILGFQEGVIFAGVGLFPGLCGFVLAAPAQLHTKHGGRTHPQSTSWREDTPKKDQQQSKASHIQRVNINGMKGIPRVSSSEDQRGHTTESHKFLTIEVHTTNSGSQNRSI